LCLVLTDAISFSLTLILAYIHTYEIKLYLLKVILLLVKSYAISHDDVLSAMTISYASSLSAFSQDVDRLIADIVPIEQFRGTRLAERTAVPRSIYTEAQPRPLPSWFTFTLIIVPRESIRPTTHSRTHTIELHTQ